MGLPPSRGSRPVVPADEVLLIGCEPGREFGLEEVLPGGVLETDSAMMVVK